jgi:hypothetical protein
MRDYLKLAGRFQFRGIPTQIIQEQSNLSIFEK